MNRKVLAMGLAAAVSTFGPFLAYERAAGADPFSTCGAGSLCEWKNDPTDNKFIAFGANQDNYHDFNYFNAPTTDVDNDTTILKSMKVNSVSVYQNLNHNVGNPGGRKCFVGGDATTYNLKTLNWPSVGGGMNDSLSSHLVQTATPACP